MAQDRVIILELTPEEAGRVWDIVGDRPAREPGTIELWRKIREQLHQQGVVYGP